MWVWVRGAGSDPHSTLLLYHEPARAYVGAAGPAGEAGGDGSSSTSSTSSTSTSSADIAAGDCGDDGGGGGGGGYPRYWLGPAVESEAIAPPPAIPAGAAERLTVVAASRWHA